MTSSRRQRRLHVSPLRMNTYVKTGAKRTPTTCFLFIFRAWSLRCRWGGSFGAVLPPFERSGGGQQITTWWSVVQLLYNLCLTLYLWTLLDCESKRWRCERHGVFSLHWDSRNSSRRGSFAYLFSQWGCQLEDQRGAYIPVSLSTLYQIVSFTASTSCIFIHRCSLFLIRNRRWRAWCCTLEWTGRKPQEVWVGPNNRAKFSLAVFPRPHTAAFQCCTLKSVEKIAEPGDEAILVLVYHCLVSQPLFSFWLAHKTTIK